MSGFAGGVATASASCVRNSAAVANRISGRVSSALSTTSSSLTSICTRFDGGSSLSFEHHAE